MSRKGNRPLRRYLNTTQTLLYSYLISLPLLLLYELLIYLSQPSTEQIVRISVDVWFKSLFSLLGRDVISITLIVIALAGVLILFRERKRLPSLKLRYFVFMLAEAALYAFLLALLISATVSNLLNLLQNSPVETLSLAQQLALSLGAGIYEELFFRVILVSSLLYLFRNMLAKKNHAYALAIVVAALIFSGVHYLGAMGDVFTLGSFLFRFLFGLALNAIYLWRGFGMAAWTHALYDVMVVVF